MKRKTHFLVTSLMRGLNSGMSSCFVMMMTARNVGTCEEILRNDLTVYNVLLDKFPNHITNELMPN